MSLMETDVNSASMLVTCYTAIGNTQGTLRVAQIALARAEKLARRAASVGFDWPDTASVLEKTDEELGEVASAIMSEDKVAIAEEIGDLLFAVANLARHLGVDPEAALRDANLKFSRRFAHVEGRARQDGVPLAEAGLPRLDGYWNEIRASDKLKPQA